MCEFKIDSLNMNADDFIINLKKQIEKAIKERVKIRKKMLANVNIRDHFVDKGSEAMAYKNILRALNGFIEKRTKNKG